MKKVFRSFLYFALLGLIVPAMIAFAPGVTFGQGYAASHSGSSSILPVSMTSGAGLNDIVVAGTYTGSGERCYAVEIDATGSPDTFKWRASRTFGDYTTGVSVATTATTLDNGVTVAWKANTGHTLAAHWEFCAKSVNPLIVKDSAGKIIAEAKNNSSISYLSSSVTSQNKYIAFPVIGADGTHYLATNQAFADISNTTTLTAAMSNQRLYSDSVGNAKTYTLPPWTQGLIYHFGVGSAGLLTVAVDSSSDTIQCGASTSTVSVSSATKGEGITLVGSPIANLWMCEAGNAGGMDFN